MKELKMKECKRSTNVTEIKEFEDFIEAKLPKDYIEHLLKYNGGRSEEDCYPFIELPALDDTIGDIHYFYALYEGGTMSSVDLLFHFGGMAIFGAFLIRLSDFVAKIKKTIMIR